MEMITLKFTLLLWVLPLGSSVPLNTAPPADQQTANQTTANSGGVTPLPTTALPSINIVKPSHSPTTLMFSTDFWLASTTSTSGAHAFVSQTLNTRNKRSTELLNNDPTSPEGNSSLTSAQKVTKVESSIANTPSSTAGAPERLQSISLTVTSPVTNSTKIAPTNRTTLQKATTGLTTLLRPVNSLTSSNHSTQTTSLSTSTVIQTSVGENVEKTAPSTTSPPPGVQTSTIGSTASPTALRPPNEKTIPIEPTPHPDPGTSNEKKNTNSGGIAAAIIIGGTLMLLLLSVAGIFIRKRHQQQRKMENPDWAGPTPFRDGEIHLNTTLGDDDGASKVQLSKKTSLQTFLPQRFSKRISLLKEPDVQIDMQDLHKTSTFGQAKDLSPQTSNGGVAEATKSPSEASTLPVNADAKLDQPEHNGEATTNPPTTDALQDLPPPLLDIDLGPPNEENQPTANQTSEVVVVPPPPPILIQ